MQVLPGIYLVNGFPYGRHQNGYVVRTRDGAVMVDSGDLHNESFETVMRSCALWGIQPADLTHLFVTHAHFDHSSHAARLRGMGVRVVASRETADGMAAGDDRCIGYAVHRRFEPCETDIVVEDGQAVEVGGLRFRCTAAPGHAAGLMIYEVELAGRRVWFCGDLVEVGAECASLQLGWAGGPDYDRETYLVTLGRLKDRGFEDLLPGHGPPGIGIGRRLIDMAYTKAMLEWR